MNQLINIFTYAFDLFIIMTYFNNTLDSRKKNLPAALFWSSFVTTEIVLFANEHLSSSFPDNISFVITITISFLTSFGLSFLYDSNLVQKIFTAISFQILAMFGEYTFTMIMHIVRPKMFDHITPELNIPMNLGSKVVLLLAILVITSAFGKSFKFITFGYNLLLFTTPVISLVIMIFTPLENIVHDKNQFFFLSIYLCLAILNIANYILLQQSHKQTAEIYRLKQMETLASYQQEKYAQLSIAYKTNRSLIHDTKKHYFVIQKHLENKAYEKLSEYLNISIKDLEGSYSEINTGNLVIDSFVSNYKNLCNDMRIAFAADLSLDPNRIPISDYDLCIILGNILDNAVNACNKNTTCRNHIKLTITCNDNDMFYIHSENTYNLTYDSLSQDDSLIPVHGYGMKNIKKIVDNNHGIINYRFDDLFHINLVFPILDDKMRIQPPPKIYR